MDLQQTLQVIKNKSQHEKPSRMDLNAGRLIFTEVRPLAITYVK